MILLKTNKALLCLLLFAGIGAGNNVSAQTIRTVAGILKSACGSAPCGDGGQAISAQLYSPSGMAIDGNNNIYIAEFSNHAVRRIDFLTGIITTYAGIQRSACLSAPCGNGGPASSANLNGPRGVGIDANNNVYIADMSNHVIRKVDKTTGIISTVAGTIRSSCGTLPCGDGGLATSAQLTSPIAVTFDAAGNMYISDYGNHAIRKVDKNTGIITTVGGTLKSACAAAPCGDGGPATSAFFNGPSGIDFDSFGNLYIAEYGNHSIRKINMSNGLISTVAGTQRSSCATSPCGDGGLATDSRLTSPFSLTINGNDDLYIADASNAAIRKVDKNTGIITTVAGTIRSSCGVVPCGDGGSPSSAQLSNPFAVQFNSLGDMYVLEYSNQALRMVNFSILPVKFADLQAQHKNSAIHLQWKALDETDVIRYEVEKAGNDNVFKKIGEVIATANGASSIQYTFTDPNPYPGNNLYRIKSVDKDAALQYSQILRVSSSEQAAKIRVFPNPVTDQKIQLQFSGAKAGMHTLHLYNSNGQIVHTENFFQQAGAAFKEIHLTKKPIEGFYVVSVAAGKKLLHKEKIYIR